MQGAEALSEPPAKGPAKLELRSVIPGASLTLEQFSASPLLESGRINLLSLDAIVERFGSKWAGRREAVYDYTERTLARHVGESGFCSRVSDRDFLVILPGESPHAAQLRCIGYLREVLMHFLGRAEIGDIAIRRVTTISKDGLGSALIDPLVVADAVAKGDWVNETKPARSAAAPMLPVGSVDRWTPFIASNGQRVRVSCGLEAVFELKNYTRIGNRITRRVIDMHHERPLSADETLRLSRADIERIDLATVARGIDRLSTETGDDFTLIIPASFITLSHLQGRMALAGSFADARRFVKSGVICEFLDIEGAPLVALGEATTLVKPLCLFIIGGLRRAPERSLADLRDVGFRGVSFEAPEGMVDDGEFSAWAKVAIGAAKTVAKSVMVYRLNSPRHVALAALLGATHASLRADVRS